MKAFRVLLVVPAMVIAVTAGGASFSKETPCANVIDPTSYVANVDNPYLPLVPGTTFIYQGAKEGVPASNEVYVMHATEPILGVNCVVVRDRAFESGQLVEETVDWYAQDRDGNVWYFGEDATEFPSGSKEGSWRAGVAGALPGIIMEAHPRVGDSYHQECASGVAEDMAKVANLNRSETVPYGTFDDLVQTKEWSPLDPGVVEQKYYAPGVGFISGIMVKGGSEFTELVSITNE